MRFSKITAGVSGISLPSFQSMPQAFKPALRKERVKRELPEKTSRMNGVPSDTTRWPSRLKDHSDGTGGASSRTLLGSVGGARGTSVAARSPGKVLRSFWRLARGGGDTPEEVATRPRRWRLARFSGDSPEEVATRPEVWRHAQGTDDLGARGSASSICGQASSSEGYRRFEAAMLSNRSVISGSSVDSWRALESRTTLEEEECGKDVGEEHAAEEDEVVEGGGSKTCGADVSWMPRLALG